MSNIFFIRWVDCQKSHLYKYAREIKDQDNCSNTPPEQLRSQIFTKARGTSCLSFIQIELGDLSCPPFSERWQPLPGWHQTLLPRSHEVMPHADGPGPGNQATRWYTLRSQPLRAGKGISVHGMEHSWHWKTLLWSLCNLETQSVRYASNINAFTNGVMIQVIETLMPCRTRS